MWSLNNHEDKDASFLYKPVLAGNCPESFPQQKLSSSPATFSNGDAILFTYSSGTGSVSLGGTVSPFIFVVNNNTLPYNFSGNGIAGSVKVTKQTAARWPSP